MFTGAHGKENDPIFDDIIRTCDKQRVKSLMGLRYHWNKEITAQCFATIHFGHLDNERAMFSMTNGRRLHITFPNFLALFDIMEGDKNFPKLHDEGLFEQQAMYFMYPRGGRA
jgi:hypothetical protein